MTTSGSWSWSFPVAAKQQTGAEGGSTAAWSSASSLLMFKVLFCHGVTIVCNYFVVESEEVSEGQKFAV